MEFIQNNKKTKRIRNKRAVSEVITTLLLLGITVVAASIIFIVISDSDIGTTSGTFGSRDTGGSVGSSTERPLKMIGFDTRDGIDLLGITGLSNIPNSLLCTESCPDPLITDYILIKVFNPNVFDLPINNIQVNGVLHTFDSSKVNLEVVANPPDPGKYSILKSDDSTFNSDSINVVQSSVTVVIIHLSEGIIPDIALDDPIRVNLNTGAKPHLLNIPSGRTG